MSPSKNKGKEKQKKKNSPIERSEDPYFTYKEV
jgi:hypothetical protein